MKQKLLHFFYFATSLLVTVSTFVPSAPAEAASRREIGIATSATLLRMNDKDLDARLKDIQNLGASWIRVDFSWPAIQPGGPNTYHWAMYDRVVRVAGVHHLKILAVLDYTAPWAQDMQCAALVVTRAAATKCNPRAASDFGHFASVISYRYRHQAIRAWEIWNEPNLSAYWKTVHTDNAVITSPQTYAAVANAAAVAIKHHDPDSVIITGGLAPMFEPTYPKGMRQSDYLTQVLPRLRADLFTGIGVHPYSWPVMPGKAAVYNAFYTVDNGSPQYNLRTVMMTAGWGNKEVWGTEFGATTKGIVTTTTPTAALRPDHVNEAAQAQIVGEGIRDWYSKQNVGPLFVHTDSDQWLIDRKNEGGFGLRRADGTKKPAYDAFRAAAAKYIGT